MPVTQKDIAKALNVSQGLVAQVLGNRKDARATEETRERILRMAAEMDYRPNMAARSLRSGRTHTVMFAYLRPPDDNIRYYHAMIVEKMAESLGAEGYSLHVRAFTKPQILLDSLSDAVATRTCDLVVLIGSDEVIFEEAALLTKLDMPFAVIGRHEVTHPEWLQMDFDHEGMMEGAVSHVYSLGHRRIAFFSHDNLDTYNLCLRQGFIDAVKARPDVVFRDDFLSQTGPHSPPGADLVEQWMALPESERPTALVVATGDRNWVDTEMALAQMGRRVGEADGDFTITGITADRYPLILGDAHAYIVAQTGIDQMADALVNQLIMPSLKGETIIDPVLRYLPQMERVETSRIDGLRLAVEDFISRRAG